MDNLLDFYLALAIFAGYSLPFLLVAWAVENWWTSLPRLKRHTIRRKISR